MCSERNRLSFIKNNFNPPLFLNEKNEINETKGSDTKFMSSVSFAEPRGEGTPIPSRASCGPGTSTRLAPLRDGLGNREAHVRGGETLGGGGRE